MLKIIPIPAFKDNYIWAITNTATKQVAIVDPGDATPVFDFLQQNNLQLSKILVTHHHNDHTGGISDLVRKYKTLVINTENIQADKKLFLAEQNLNLNIIAIPGHTLDHIAFYNDELLFCGDTLFAAGCGRVFEGTPAQMLNSLQKLKSLSPNTKIYCGHEYTVNNLRFALAVEPDNMAIQKRLTESIELRDNKLPTLPSTMAVELATNPFLRTDQVTVRQAVIQHCGKDLTDEVDVFAQLRAWKNARS